MVNFLRLKALLVAGIFSVASFNAHSNFLENCDGFSQENWVCFDTFNWTHTEGDDDSGVPQLVIAASQHSDGFSLHFNVGEGEKLGALGFEFEDTYVDLFQDESSWGVFDHLDASLNLNDDGTPLADYSFLTDSTGSTNENFNGLKIDGEQVNWDVLFAFETDSNNVIKLTFHNDDFSLDKLSGFYFGLRAQATGDDNENSFKGYATGEEIFTPQCVEPCVPDVPEPNSLLIFGLALFGLALARKRFTH
ncbi:PEP-CTERM sorting domain-containing protein [Thalassomonas sp. M1454]|uniref:PEP-CTERM sorting domain-containing protein n=1 Tax=Thalassomonas sp. M1454 TaxID=2594477 RepID=UPI00118141F5|nr:PEP-CTERM sorting domain-containing protein [Thalassomonas sp. M1454]TRX53139.1 PEP-CTERM sorting domain-containing protein [Thalassomonas sp. M1454]